MATGDSRTVIGELLAFINTVEDRICPHTLTWQEALPGRLRPPPGGQHRRLRWSRDGRNFLCLLAHDRGCLCRGAALPLARPNQCESCPTDFVMTAAEFPGLPTRVLVLATWKLIAERPPRIVGNRELHEDGEIRGYRQQRSPVKMYPDVIIPWSGVFPLFEEDSFVGPDGNYRPWMKPLDIGRLVDFGDRLEHEGPNCGLPHRTGPDNRILHPDPEEDSVVST